MSVLLGYVGQFRMRIIDEYKRNQIVTVFLIAMVLIFVFTSLVSMIMGGWPFVYNLLSDAHDIFMDHFNSLVVATDGPYTHHTSSYPALMTLIYQAYGEFAREFTTIYDPNFGLAFNMRDSQVPMLCLMLSALVMLIAYHYVFSRYFENKFTRNQFAAIFVIMLLSYPSIFAIERGNSIFLAVLFMMLYLCGYKSENRWVRLLSYVCLGVATGVKILPAVLGILTLKHRGLREFIYCVVIVSVLLIVPFIFTDGTFLMILDYAFGFLDDIAARHGYINISDFASALGLGGVAVTIIAVVVMAFFILCVLIDKHMEEWQEITVLSVLVIICFSFTAPYMYLYLLIPAYYFLSKEKALNYVNALSLISFILVFSLLPAFSYNSIELTLLRSCSMFIMIVVITIVSFKHILAYKELSEAKKIILSNMKKVIAKLFINPKEKTEENASVDVTGASSDHPDESPVPRTVIYCGNCGFANFSYNNFCMNCGLRLYKPNSPVYENQEGCSEDCSNDDLEEESLGTDDSFGDSEQ